MHNGKTGLQDNRIEKIYNGIDNLRILSQKGLQQ